MKNFIGVSENPEEMTIKKMNDKKVVVVTGVGGQDGGLMVEYLLRNTNHYVVGVSRNDRGNAWSLNPRYFFVRDDITDRNFLSKCYKPFGHLSYFLNFAAQTNVKRSWDDPVGTYKVNMDSVLMILDWLRLYNPQCRFLNAGSSEEFGEACYSPQDELHPLNPVSPYGMSKVSARQIVDLYRNHYKMFAVQPWFFNHEGPRRGKEFVTRKITTQVVKLYHYIKSGRSCVAPWIELGNLNAKRDWSNAEDVVDAVWKMINADTPFNYVVSSGEGHTIKEFVETAFDIVGIKGCWVGSGIDEVFLYESGPSPTPSDKCVLVKVNPAYYRPVEVKDACGNSIRLRQDLKWEPKSNFKDIVLDMVENDKNKLLFSVKKID